MQQVLVVLYQLLDFTSIESSGQNRLAPSHVYCDEDCCQKHDSIYSEYEENEGWRETLSVGEHCEFVDAVSSLLRVIQVSPFNTEMGWVYWHSKANKWIQIRFKCLSIWYWYCTKDRRCR